MKHYTAKVFAVLVTCLVLASMQASEGRLPSNSSNVSRGSSLPDCDNIFQGSSSAAGIGANPIAEEPPAFPLAGSGSSGPSLSSATGGFAMQNGESLAFRGASPLVSSSMEGGSAQNGNSFNPFRVPSAAGGQTPQLFGGGGSVNANAGTFSSVRTEGTSEVPSTLPAAPRLKSGAAHWSTVGPQGNERGPQSTGGPRPEGGRWGPKQQGGPRTHEYSRGRGGPRTHEYNRWRHRYRYNSGLPPHGNTKGQQEGSEGPPPPPRSDSFRSDASNVGTEDTWLKRRDEEEEEEEEEEEGEQQQLLLQSSKRQQPQQQHRQRQHPLDRGDRGQRKEEQRGVLRMERELLFLNDLPRTTHQETVEYLQQLEAPSALTRYLQLEPKTDMPFYSDNCSDVAQDGSDTSPNNHPEVDDDGQWVRKRTELFDPPAPYVMRRLPKRLPEEFLYYGRTGDHSKNRAGDHCSDGTGSPPPS